jgi:formylglycine-generating enzyme required for sulfatase activity
VVQGPTLIAVSNFFVDSTEVTEDQYNQFLTAKNGDVSGQPSVCSFNTTYYGEATALTPGSTLPMANVDWCDARAYCDWAGKRLCGQIGGGAVAAEDATTPSLSQWVLACGGPGGGTHPNNNPECNSNGGFGNVAPVATFPGCEGFYPGLFDLEGNVAEWVDSCDGETGAADICLLLGGNIIDNVSYCDEIPFTNRRDDTAYTFGFRCCSR